MICQHCGRENFSHASYCAACGAPVGGNQTYGSDPSQWSGAGTYAAPKSRSNTALAVISYFTFIGLVIAFLLGDRDDEYLRYHENQALNMAIAGLICTVLSWSALLSPLAFVGSVFVAICTIVGIVYAATGQAKPVLFFANWQLIK